MRHHELRTVSRAAFGLAAALAALTTAVLTAETATTLIRTAWTVADGHIARSGEILFAMLADPVASQVVGLAVATLILGALAARSLGAVKEARCRASGRRRPRH